MTAIIRALKYLQYFFEADTKELRQEAREAARHYYSTRPNLKTIDNFQSFQRGFKNVRCRKAARDKLGLS
jgi:hypothetical protein